MINNIQALRAFAALNVVLFHTFGQTARVVPGSHLAAFFGNWGNCGVDIFFVISGFIMIYTQDKSPKNSVDFITNRAKKIIPLYWSVSLFFVALLIAAPAQFNHGVFNWKHTITSLLFLSRTSGYDFPVLDPGWTLEYEMFFYILFGLSISIKKIHSFFTVSLILLASTIFFNLNSIVLEFAFGMLIGLFFLRGWFKQYGLAIFLLGCAGMLLSLFFDIELVRVVKFGLPATFIVLGACYLPQTKNAFLIQIGSASYSIYITHAITLPAFYKIIKLSTIPATRIAPDVITLACLICATGVGIVVYWYYEKPIAKILR